MNKSETEIRNTKMIIQYDGTNYAGFQIQKNEPTIQAVLQEKLELIYQKEINISYAGRTDAGVHARGQVINYTVAKSIPVSRLCWSMNNILPTDIAIVEAEEVDLDFDARRNALLREYRYYILNSSYSNPFEHRYYLQHHRILDIEAMNKAAKNLLGKHDFTSFTISEDSSTSKFRELKELEIFTQEDGKMFVIKIIGNAYLQHMVRTIVGTLLEIGRGEKKPESMKIILDSKDRSLTGEPAPAQGLFLHRVYY